MKMTGVHGDDGIEGLKSVTPYQGDVFDLVIIEEATEIKDEEVFEQIMLRQRGSKDSKFPVQAYLLFNPINISHWLYERFFKPIEDDYDFNNGRECLEYHSEDLLIHKSTYEDNEYIGEAEIKSYNDMYDRSPSMWRVYSQGDFGVIGELVFEDNIEYVDDLPNGLDRLPWRLGVDHGYNDFQTFVISKYDAKNNTIYVVDTIQERKSLPKQFSDQMKVLMNKYHIGLGIPIFADSSDPTKNALLTKYGLNVRKAIKGSGSKMTGIMWLKGNKIVVPKRLKDIKESFGIYIWKKKNGVLLDDTEHSGSDLLDALRYSYELDSRNNVEIFGKHAKF